MNKNIKWGSMIPLIGGMTIGNKMAINADPTVIFSYSAFYKNDLNCINYFKNTPYIVIDSYDNEEELNEEIHKYENLDFVSIVPPCAGLSTFNSCKNGDKKLGSDAIQNQWMYKSTEFLMKNIKPKVILGENAPALYSKLGENVVLNLKTISKKYGYVMSLIKTDTYLHGIPQHRKRTFFIFWKNDKCPIISYYDRKSPNLKTYLKDVPTNSLYNDRFFGIDYFKNHPISKYFKYKNISLDEVQSTINCTINYLINFNLLDDCILYFKNIINQEHSTKEDLKFFKFIQHLKEKLSKGERAWISAPYILKDEYTNAIVGRNNFLILKDEERGLTLRETMYLMGLPHDFELKSNEINHICQNVPTCTARDITYEILKFLNGEIKEFKGTFVKQNKIGRAHV